MAGKSPEAFRTISEVADWLDRPAHVLRFWESKFNQIKPVKRAGGRRYYRPEDMLLLGGIKKLLHDDGMTIKGAQKVLRDQGVRYVSGLSQPLDEDTAALTGDVLEAVAQGDPTPVRDAAPAMPRHDMVAPVPEDAFPAAFPEDDDGFVDQEAEAAPARAEGPVDVMRPAPVATAEPTAANSPDAPEPVPEPMPPLGADLPPPPDLDAIRPEPGILSAIAARKVPLSATDRAAIGPLVAQLDGLVARLSSARKS